MTHPVKQIIWIALVILGALVVQDVAYLLMQPY